MSNPTTEQKLWRPIETAPNDQTILVFRPKGRQYDLVQAEDNDYNWTPYKRDGLDRPSHWMPVPEPPKS